MDRCLRVEAAAVQGSSVTSLDRQHPGLPTTSSSLMRQPSHKLSTPSIPMGTKPCQTRRSSILLGRDSARMSTSSIPRTFSRCFDTPRANLRLKWGLRANRLRSTCYQERPFKLEVAGTESSQSRIPQLLGARSAHQRPETRRTSPTSDHATPPRTAQP